MIKNNKNERKGKEIKKEKGNQKNYFSHILIISVFFLFYNF
jgi:hypothetical protein